MSSLKTYPIENDSLIFLLIGNLFAHQINQRLNNILSQLNVQITLEGIHCIQSIERDRHD